MSHILVAAKQQVRERCASCAHARVVVARLMQAKRQIGKCAHSYDQYTSARTHSHRLVAGMPGQPLRIWWGVVLVRFLRICRLRLGHSIMRTQLAPITNQCNARAAPQCYVFVYYLISIEKLASTSSYRYTCHGAVGLNAWRFCIASCQCADLLVGPPALVGRLRLGRQASCIDIVGIA